MSNQEPMFPILNDPMIKSIPWAVMLPHEKQAQRNHSQTLRGLAGRGGLSIHEAYHIIRDEEWPYRTFKRSKLNDAKYRMQLMIVLHEFEATRPTGGSNHGE